jgi:hypothetical protein
LDWKSKNECGFACLKELGRAGREEERRVGKSVFLYI